MLQIQLESISRQGGQARALAIQHLAKQLEMNLENNLEELKQFLGSPSKNLRVVAVQIIRAIGYPQNARVLPHVLEEFTDVNSPALREVMRALDDLEEEIASAYLLQLFWKHAFEYKESPYSHSELAYFEVLDCVCNWISEKETKRAYAEAVGPLLAATINRWSKDPFIRDAVLDTLEKIGPASGNYALPALLEWAEREKGSQAGQRVWKFIQSFERGVLAPYHLVLDQVQLSYPEAG